MSLEELMRSACIAGITPERFWTMTAHEISIEIEAYNTRWDWNNYLVGMLCAVISEPHRDKKKRPQPFGPYDFVPKPGVKQERSKQTWEDMLRVCEFITVALGGTDTR